MPPLNVSDQEIDEAAALIDEALQRCAQAS
jgi:hypothetical protein